MAAGSTGISPRGGSFKTRGNTATANTAYTIGIPPFPGKGRGGNMLYGVDPAGNPNWWSPGYYTRVNYFKHLNGSTAHTLYWLRPLNWAVVSVAGAKNTTSFTLATDWGKYSTGFHYPTAGGGTPGANGVTYTQYNQASDITVTTTDYFAVQLVDGTWFFDLVAGYSTSTFVVTTTTTIPNVTGGGIPKGAVAFLLGSSSRADPNTGFGAPPAEYPNASTAEEYKDCSGDGVCTSVHPGDPMMLYNANATAASFTGGLSGSYVLL